MNAQQAIQTLKDAKVLNAFIDSAFNTNLDKMKMLLAYATDKVWSANEVFEVYTEVDRQYKPGFFSRDYE